MDIILNLVIWIILCSYVVFSIWSFKFLKIKPLIPLNFFLSLAAVPLMLFPVLMAELIKSYGSTVITIPIISYPFVLDELIFYNDNVRFIAFVFPYFFNIFACHRLRKYMYFREYIKGFRYGPALALLLGHFVYVYLVVKYQIQLSRGIEGLKLTAKSPLKDRTAYLEKVFGKNHLPTSWIESLRVKFTDQNREKELHRSLTKWLTPILGYVIPAKTIRLIQECLMKENFHSEAENLLIALAGKKDLPAKWLSDYLKESTEEQYLSFILTWSEELAKADLDRSHMIDFFKLSFSYLEGKGQDELAAAKDILEMTFRLELLPISIFEKLITFDGNKYNISDTEIYDNCLSFAKITIANNESKKIDKKSHAQAVEALIKILANLSKRNWTREFTDILEWYFKLAGLPAGCISPLTTRLAADGKLYEFSRNIEESLVLNTFSEVVDYAVTKIDFYNIEEYCPDLILFACWPDEVVSYDMCNGLAAFLEENAPAWKPESKKNWGRVISRYVVKINDDRGFSVLLRQVASFLDFSELADNVKNHLIKCGYMPNRIYAIENGDVGGMGGFAGLASRRVRECPKCGGHMREFHSMAFMLWSMSPKAWERNEETFQHERTNWKCLDCGSKFPINY